MKYERLGKIIKNKREGLGIKLELLAADCEVRSPSYIWRIESGQIPVSSRVLKKLVRALDLDPIQLKQALIEIAIKEVEETICELTRPE
jgi:transcriptional regulator with XRE-family HTH domain